MQIIIFKSSKNKSSSYKINGSTFIIIIGFLISSLVFLLSSSIYIYGYKIGYKDLFDETVLEVDKYKNEIRLIKQENKNKMQFFSQKLITMSSEIESLDALGHKISSIGKINKKEFNFKESRYIGGTNKINIEFEYNSDFDKYLDKMLIDLSIREDNLKYLFNVVNNMEMKEQFLPTGFPSKKGYMSSDYGNRKDPFSKKTHFHKGIDIAHKIETDIISLAAGEVIFSGNKYGYGNVVVISHLNGYTTKYAHNNRNIVKKGEKVKKGQIIAKMGSTGHSTGSHIHLEVLRNNKHIDPTKFIHYKEKFSIRD